MSELAAVDVVIEALGPARQRRVGMLMDASRKHCGAYDARRGPVTISPRFVLVSPKNQEEGVTI